MISIYSNGEKITYTAGDTFLMEVSSEKGFDEGAQLKLQIAENETAPLLVDATYNQVAGGFEVSLSDREKEKLAIGNYIYKLVIVNIAGEIITQKSGDLIVKWGVLEMSGLNSSNLYTPGLKIAGGTINRKKVYESGYKDGHTVGYNEGYSAGETDGYKSGESKGYNDGYNTYCDLIWEAFQDGGKRTDYKKAFYNWDKFTECFKPKYDIKPTGSVVEMFADINQYTSVPNACAARGITIDFSKATDFRNMLKGSAIWHFGVVDCSSSTTLEYAFNLASSLQKIDKLILHEGITNYSACFANTSLLKNITIEGTIAGTGIVLTAHTGLTHDSLMSFINALKDYSGTTTTKTITLGATNLAKLTDSEKAVATQKGWTLA